MTKISAHEIAAHAYLSTACWHAINDGDPELHKACRNTCKYCDKPCGCPVCHPESGTQPYRTTWVDQARKIARTMYGLVPERLIDRDLAERIATDPGLFWLRGEEAPAGEWTPPLETN